MKSLIATLAFLVLAACGQSQPGSWYKPDATQQDLEAAMARCHTRLASLASHSTGAPGDLQDAASYVRYANECMTAEGWSRAR